MLARTGRIMRVGATVVYIRVLDLCTSVSQEGTQLRWNRGHLICGGLYSSSWHVRELMDVVRVGLYQ